MIPIKYSCTITFEPMHETTLGSDMDGNFLDKAYQFPYNQEGRKRASIIPALMEL